MNISHPGISLHIQITPMDQSQAKQQHTKQLRLWALLVQIKPKACRGRESPEWIWPSVGKIMRGVRLQFGPANWRVATVGDAGATAGGDRAQGLISSGRPRRWAGNHITSLPVSLHSPRVPPPLPVRLWEMLMDRKTHKHTHPATHITCSPAYRTWVCIHRGEIKSRYKVSFCQKH